MLNLPERSEPRRAAFEPAGAAAAYRVVGALARRLHVEVAGLEHVPSGRALIVANHAFGWDVLFAMSAVWHDKRRIAWALGDHVFWKVPFVGRIATTFGTVDGTPENVDRLLARDELVVVQPGGVREAVKPRELRYRLLWGDRYGFIRAAIRNQAPIVPLACVGADDLFDLVGNAYERGGRWLKRDDIPLPLPAWFFPFPRRVKLRYVFGETIFPRVSREHEHDADVVREMRRHVEGALHELLEGELIKRAGISTRSK